MPKKGKRVKKPSSKRSRTVDGIRMETRRRRNNPGGSTASPRSEQSQVRGHLRKRTGVRSSPNLSRSRSSNAPQGGRARPSGRGRALRGGMRARPGVVNRERYRPGQTRGPSTRGRRR